MRLRKHVLRHILEDQPFYVIMPLDLTLCIILELMYAANVHYPRKRPVQVLSSTFYDHHQLPRPRGVSAA